MTMIIRLALINRHVDLAHISSVGEAQFIDRMGHGGWFCGFDIDFFLHDTPRRYEWRAGECGGVRFEGTTGPHEVEYEDGTWSDSPYLRDHGELVCVKNLNARILRDIIEPWKTWKDHAGA